MRDAVKRNAGIRRAWPCFGLLTKKLLPFSVLGAIAFAVAVPSEVRGPELSEKQQEAIQRNFRLCVSKLKGPYTENFCVCKNGAKESVTGPDGRVRSPCAGTPRYCAAYRAPWAQALATDAGMYIGNIFSRDLYEWESFPDHHDLVRGYILEKYFVDTHPKHKLAQLRAYGGLSGSEYEAAAAPEFFERYLTLPTFNDSRHFILAYELQKRFYVRGNQGQIQTARALAMQIQSRDAKFKPLRDATHNQISAALIPKLTAYRNKLPQGQTRAKVGELIAEIDKLTALDETALTAQIADVEGEPLRKHLTALVPPADADTITAISALAQLMVLARQTVAARQVTPGDARRLIDLDITAAAVIQARGSALLDSGDALTVEQCARVLLALTDASYGDGLLTGRERDAASAALQGLLDTLTHDRAACIRQLEKAGRIVEWAQAGALLAFAEVRPAWMLVLPDTALIGDDILRGSPLLLYAQFAGRLGDYVSGKDPIRHHIFGSEVSTEIRALNPGLAKGALRVAPAEGTYSRNEIVALPETPTELQPAAGILTQGEGNVVSHVQLLARALGIPNFVVGRCVLDSTPFLPKKWRSVLGERTPSKKYQNLWIISRGPTSHGCTRLASGHMTEMR